MVVSPTQSVAAAAAPKVAAVTAEATE